jgi:thioredoxin 1
MSSQTVKEKITANEIQNSKGYMLVDFWAEWCMPCKRLAPIFELSSQQNKDVQFVKVNVDENPELSSMHSVRSIPTMILFKDGKPTQTRVGGMDLIALNEWIAQNTK